MKKLILMTTLLAFAGGSFVKAETYAAAQTKFFNALKKDDSKKIIEELRNIKELRQKQAKRRKKRMVIFVKAVKDEVVKLANKNNNFLVDLGTDLRQDLGLQERFLEKIEGETAKKAYAQQKEIEKLQDDLNFLTKVVDQTTKDKKIDQGEKEVLQEKINKLQVKIATKEMMDNVVKKQLEKQIEQLKTQVKNLKPTITKKEEKELKETTKKIEKTVEKENEKKKEKVKKNITISTGEMTFTKKSKEDTKKLLEKGKKKQEEKSELEKQAERGEGYV